MAAVWHPLSMPPAVWLGGGRRPALIGDATRLHSVTKGDGPSQRRRSFSAEYARILTAGNTTSLSHRDQGVPFASRGDLNAKRDKRDQGPATLKKHSRSNDPPVGNERHRRERSAA